MRRRYEGLSGEMRPTRVRRLSSWLSGSSVFVDRIRFRCGSGNWYTASISPAWSSRSLGTSGSGPPVRKRRGRARSLLKRHRGMFWPGAMLLFRNVRRAAVLRQTDFPRRARPPMPSGPAYTRSFFGAAWRAGRGSPWGSARLWHGICCELRRRGRSRAGGRGVVRAAVFRAPITRVGGGLIVVDNQVPRLRGTRLLPGCRSAGPAWAGSRRPKGGLRCCGIW